MFILLLIGVVNGVLLTSGVSLMHVDMVYLNGLLITLSAIYCLYDYIRFNQSLLKVHKQLLQTKQLDMEALANDKILYEIVDQLEVLHESQLLTYKDAEKELEDYLNRWIHEIKIPIAVATMISEQVDEETSKELTYEIERIKYYVNQALYVMRATDASKDLFIESVEVKPVVYEVVKNYRVFFMQKDLLVDVEAVKDISVKTDKQWFVYTIQQIVHNAIKYSEPSGSITFKVLDQNDKTVITIIDQGIGISDQDLPKVFKKGFVGSNGRAHKTATGMGMYLSKKMMNRLGGDVSVSSNLDKGTTFTIEIPIQSVM